MIRLIFLTTVCFCVLLDFAFRMGNFVIPFYYAWLSAFFIILPLFKFNFVITKTVKLIKLPVFKTFILFLCWILFGLVVSMFLGTFEMKSFFKYFIGGLIFSSILVCLLMVEGLPSILSFKSFIKLVTIIFFFIFIVGIIDLLSIFLDFNSITDFIRLFANRATLLNDAGIQRGIAYSYGLPRISSIFQEPSHFGYFILLTWPIVYTITFSTNKLFESSYLEILLRRSLFPLMVIDLLLTQSPIFILFGVLTIIIYKSYNFVKKNIKYVPLTVVFIFILLFYSSFVLKEYKEDILSQLSGTFLNRIILTTQNLNSIEDFIIAEPSLGTRIIVFYNCLIIFIHHPIVGIGYGNLGSNIVKQLAISDIPLTEELQDALLEDKNVGGQTILLKTLAETGIVGTYLFYLFLLNLIKTVDKRKLYYEKIEKDFFISLKYFLIMLICLSIYDSSINSSYIWIFLGTVLAMIINSMNNVNTLKFKMSKIWLNWQYL